MRQGDLLSLFLFVLVKEALTRLTYKVASIGDFKGFQINEEVETNIFQFADDTIMLVDGSIDNLWSMKAILSGF